MSYCPLSKQKTNSRRGQRSEVCVTFGLLSNYMEQKHLQNILLEQKNFYLSGKGCNQSLPMKMEQANVQKNNRRLGCWNLQNVFSHEAVMMNVA